MCLMFCSSKYLFPGKAAGNVLSKMTYLEYTKTRWISRKSSTLNRTLPHADTQHCAQRHGNAADIVCEDSPWHFATCWHTALCKTSRWRCRHYVCTVTVTLSHMLTHSTVHNVTVTLQTLCVQRHRDALPHADTQDFAQRHGNAADVCAPSPWHFATCWHTAQCTTSRWRCRHCVQRHRDALPHADKQHCAQRHGNAADIVCEESPWHCATCWHTALCTKSG